MKINEVMKLTGLTKKAINYYEEKGIIRPNKGENNYREYTEADINTLKEIGLYRKLDLTIKEIKVLLATEESSKKNVFQEIIRERERKILTLKKQNEYITLLKNEELTLEIIEKINTDIINYENSRGEYILNELKRAFPKGMGTILANHFKPYLHVTINSEEKEIAFKNIISFFDNLDEKKIPIMVKVQFSIMTEDIIKDSHKRAMAEINSILNGDNSKLEEMKKRMLKIAELNERDIPIYDFQNKFKKSIMDYFTESGYYKVFIPNIKVLSEEYAEYNNKLNEVNDLICSEIGVGYDENYRIVKLKK